MQVLIKDFSLGDKETYAIIGELNYFFVISIPEKKKRPICGAACSNVFQLDKAKEVLVAATITHGVRREFVIPLTEEELPR